MPDVIRVFVNTPQLIKVLTGPPGPAGPPGSGGGGTGLKEYADTAELDAVTETEVGTLVLDNTEDAYPGFGALGGSGPSKFVFTTVVQDFTIDPEDVPAYGSVSIVVQYTIAGNAQGVPVIAYRFKLFDRDTQAVLSPFNAWTVTGSIPSPNYGTDFQFLSSANGVWFQQTGKLVPEPLTGQGTHQLMAGDDGFMYWQSVA